MLIYVETTQQMQCKDKSNYCIQYTRWCFRTQYLNQGIHNLNITNKKSYYCKMLSDIFFLIRTDATNKYIHHSFHEYGHISKKTKVFLVQH